MHKEELFEQLRQSDLPTVVDFWAPWCVPCVRTKPILEELAKEFDGQVNFQAINADEHPELMRSLKVLGIPTLLTVSSNHEISRVVGAQPPENYRHLFETLAAGGEMTSLPIGKRDRFLRLGIGAILVIIPWMYATWWLLPIGLLVMFWGIYDRCPIWQAVTAYLRPKLDKD
jgi:thioredoxin 1